MSQLALLGGTPVRTQPFPEYKTMGEEEVEAAVAVIRSGVLSKFLGSAHKDFLGGPEVQAFEAEWSAAVGIRHSVSVNSATSGLYAALGAAGVGPGDEVIVSPYTMSASAAAPIVYNAIPVFADINPRTFCIDAQTIADVLTPRTKAIVVVHLFGRVAEMGPIMALAEERGLIVIEDCAQAPMASLAGRQAGTWGHIGVFSLNYHKHIHTGEGGVATTDNDDLADRLRLIRNHAEAVIAGRETPTLPNMIGFNYRLGEIESAIGRKQLEKLPGLIARRRKNVALFEAGIAGIEALTPPRLDDPDSHVYYAHPLTYDAAIGGVTRDAVVKAVRAELPDTIGREGEGALIGGGYVKPLYFQPLYQSAAAYGKTSCPFGCPWYGGDRSYAAGLCPEAERAHFETVIVHEMIRPGMSPRDIQDVVDAFHKVFGNIGELAGHDA